MSDKHTSSRIQPIHPSNWDDSVCESMSTFPQVRDFVLNNWEAGQARGMNGLGAIVNHRALAKAFLTFNAHVSTDSSLTARMREILILRVSWLRHAEYEFQQHVILGLRAGLTEEEIDRIQKGPGAKGWSEADAALLKASDELIADAFITDDTWTQLRKHFSEEQLIDLVFAVGCYEVLAMAFRSFDVPFEACLERMTEEIRANMLNAKPDV